MRSNKLFAVGAAGITIVTSVALIGAVIALFKLRWWAGIVGCVFGVSFLLCLWAAFLDVWNVDWRGER